MKALALVRESLAVLSRLERVLFDEYPEVLHVIDKSQFWIDPEGKRIVVRGKSVQCGSKQISLLFFLSHIPSRCASEQDLAKYVWNNPDQNRASMRSFYRNLNEKMRESGINIRITIKSGLVCLSHLCSFETTQNAREAKSPKTDGV